MVIIKEYWKGFKAGLKKYINLSYKTYNFIQKSPDGFVCNIYKTKPSGEIYQAYHYRNGDIYNLYFDGAVNIFQRGIGLWDGGFYLLEYQNRVIITHQGKSIMEVEIEPLFVPECHVKIFFSTIKLI